ncbi:hypothetical protein JOC48_001056 [Aquibacillus albus]|uniref:Uncharacterized protein n=1 Tax=Aquibacillus albus TaxID=1168171 RepID=A0ABS2MXR9_9BACI|nr:hypothetical protein [Aquibacillus albus]
MNKIGVTEPFHRYKRDKNDLNNGGKKYSSVL